MPRAEVLQRTAKLRRMLPVLFDLPVLVRFTLSEIFDHPGETCRRIFQLGLFGHDIDIADLLLFLILPTVPLHIPEFVEGLRAFGDAPLEAFDCPFCFRRGCSQGGDLLACLAFSPLQRLALSKVFLSSCLQVGNLPPGEFDTLLLDVDGVLCSVEFFLMGSDEVFVFEEPRLQCLQRGFETLQMRPDFYLPVFERTYRRFP